MNYWILSLLAVMTCGIVLTEVYWWIRSLVRRFQSKHVLITGGSAGLGLEIAKRIASFPHSTVSIVARRKSALDESKQQIIDYAKLHGNENPIVHTETCDVCDESSVSRAVSVLCERVGPVDVLLSNAGSAPTGYMFEQKTSSYREAMELNYMGTIHVLKSVVPSMMRRKQGEVYFIASSCSMVSYVGYMSYAPTKYAIKGLADGMRNELYPYGIHVGCVYPPNMNTPGFEVENATKPAEGLFIEKYLESVYSPEVCADKVVKSIRKGLWHIVCDFSAWSLVVSNSSIGPRNNIFLDLLAIIPVMIVSGVFYCVHNIITTLPRFRSPEVDVIRFKDVAGKDKMMDYVYVSEDKGN